MAAFNPAMTSVTVADASEVKDTSVPFTVIR